VAVAPLRPAPEHAIARHAALVFASPIDGAPRALWRNAASRLAKRVAVAFVGNRFILAFNSFRSCAAACRRSLAAYCGNGVFLDVALSRVVRRRRCVP